MSKSQELVQKSPNLCKIATLCKAPLTATFIILKLGSDNMSPYHFVGKIYDSLYRGLDKIEDAIFNFGAMSHDDFEKMVTEFPNSQSNIYDTLTQEVGKQLMDKYGEDFAEHATRNEVSGLTRQAYKKMIGAFTIGEKINFYNHGGLFSASQNIYRAILAPAPVAPSPAANGNGAPQMNPANYRPVSAQA